MQGGEPPDPPPDPRRQKRAAAPISASAFSFTLGPAAKKPKPAAAAPAAAGKAPAPRPPRPPPAPRRPAPPAAAPETPAKSQAVAPAPAKTPLALGSLPSPFALSPAPRRRLTSVVLADPASPFKDKRREDTPATIGLTALPRVQLAAAVHAVQEEAEGLGVSPRKNKGAIVHRGPGPPPSVRLATLLAASNTSTVLFYTAMQHALGPSSRARSTPAQHARGAPGRLAIVAAVPGPTGAATMFRCRVLAWRGPLPDDVLVVLSPLPADCPRVGVDPRVAASASRPLEIGVWDPWSERAVPGHPTTLFLSRYLIAEAE
ncbi:hypothetical protein Q8F55_004158 [Vanrija albida]|uniref:Uncharacterized protein n=1 Tax=Vanrija albida TaxID=181172 RepID=A0ABR3Q5Z4_9TREE